MKVALRRIRGPWREGWVLDKHIIRSTYEGDDEYGHPRFNTLRTEVGEATFQLKYRGDWSQAKPLAQAIADNILHRYPEIGFIVPMPASTPRARQPVTEVANELASLVGLVALDNVLAKAPGGKKLKDLNNKQEKLDAIGDSFSVNDGIGNDGKWNVLIVDDLYDTGASMESACKALSTYRKVKDIYVATLTWK
jgi:predicted amidophosphoribosyltransferase